MEQGLREDRLQGRDRRQAAAGRCHLRHARCRLRIGALADVGRAQLRRHRPQACRSAQRRDPRCRHRHRKPQLALGAQPALADLAEHGICIGGRCHGASARRRHCRTGRARAVRTRRPDGRAAGLCAGCVRGARRPRPRQPAGAAVRARLPEGHHHARGRPHARAAPQLQGLARIHRGAVVRCRVHARQRHHRLGDGIQRDQPAATG